MTRRYRLALRPLESRDAPSGGGDIVSTDKVLFGPGEVRAANAAPVIADFRAVVGPNGQVTFTGTVRDDQPVAGYVVHITGNGVDVTATVQRDGTFAVTTVVSGQADVTVRAQTTDAAGATSDPAQTTFTPSA